MLGEDIVSRVHSPSKAWSHEEESKHKRRESLGHVLDSAAVEKREDLRLSSEVVRWLHRVALSKSTEGFGERELFAAVF